MVNGRSPRVPELGIESCYAKSTYDAVGHPDEAGYPKEDVVLAFEDGDVAVLLACAVGKGRLCLREHCNEKNNRHDDVDD